MFPAAASAEGRSVAICQGGGINCRKQRVFGIFVKFFASCSKKVWAAFSSPRIDFHRIKDKKAPQRVYLRSVRRMAAFKRLIYLKKWGG